MLMSASSFAPDFIHVSMYHSTELLFTFKTCPIMASLLLCGWSIKLLIVPTSSYGAQRLVTATSVYIT